MHLSIATATASSPLPGTLAAVIEAAIGPNHPDDSHIYQNELDDLLARLVPPVAARATGAVAAGSVATPPIAYGSYRFNVLAPMRERRRTLVQWTQEKLYDVLERLSFHRDMASGRPLPYGEIRAWWCLINLRLNELGFDCPAFRPNRRVVRRSGEGYLGDDTLLTNDRQMIDLHWIWSRCLALSPKPKHRDLFESALFNWKLAERFVGFVGSFASKIEDLRLHEDDQFCLMSLCCDKVKKRREDIRQRAELLGVLLTRQAARLSSRLDPLGTSDRVSDYVALRVANGSPSEAVEAKLRLFGEPVTSRHMGNRKRTLHKLGYRTC